MNTIRFEGIDKFTEKVNKLYDALFKKNRDNDVSIIALYEDAKGIINTLIAEYDFKISSINLTDELYDGYCDEYIITLCNIWESKDLFCEPFKRGKWIYKGMFSYNFYLG